MNGQTCQRKGKVTASPRAKAKVKARAKEHPGKWNHNQDQAGSPTEDGQRTLGAFGMKRQRVECVGDVQKNDDFECPRFDRAAYVLCVQRCNSVSMDPTELPSSSKRVSDGNEKAAGTQRESYFLPLDVKTIDQLLTLAVLSTCPVDYATSVPTEKVQYSMILESVLGESLQHYGIKRYVPFTNRSCSNMNVNFEIADTKRAILSVQKGCGNGSMIVFTPDGQGKIVNDKKCIERVKQIMESTPGFDIVYDRGAYVLVVDVNDGVYVNNERQQFEHDSGISFPGTSFESSTARP